MTGVQTCALPIFTVACDGPGAKEPWITELREASVKQASDDERALALILLKRWVEGRRE